MNPWRREEMLQQQEEQERYQRTDAVMNRCAPAPLERSQLRSLVDRTGAVNVLRMLAEIISHDHPVLAEGVRFRGELMGLARELDGQSACPPPPDVEGVNEWIEVDLPPLDQLDSERRTTEGVLGVTLADVFVVEEGGKLESAYVKVIDGVYCDWSDLPLVRRNGSTLVNGLTHEMWKDGDDRMILILADSANSRTEP